jgi:hypothetical protein
VKVIGQLEASLSVGLGDVEIEVSGYDGVPFVSFPLPAVAKSVAQTVFASGAEPFGSAGVLVTGNVVGTSVDERIGSRETAIGDAAL